MQREFVDKLEQVQSYKGNINIRESYKFFFHNIIQEWTGPNKFVLEEELDLVQVMARNKYLEWYFRTVKPKINNLVTRELDVKDIKEMPMTTFIFTYIKEV